MMKSVQRLTQDERSPQSKCKASTSALKMLNQLAWEELKLRYPEIRPELLPRPKYNDSTSNGLTKCVLHWIRLNGGSAHRINNTGRPLNQQKTFSDCLGHTRVIGSITWLPGTGTKGISDVVAVIQGKSVSIEIKHGADRMSEAQRQYQASIEKAGGIFLIARTFEGFYQDWKRLFE